MRHPNLNPLRRKGKLNTLLEFLTLLSVSAVLLTTTPAFSPQLIKDINRNENPNVNEYGEAIDLNGTLYFTSAGELWKTKAQKKHHRESRNSTA
jgi:hypothetical protein